MGIKTFKSGALSNVKDIHVGIDASYSGFSVCLLQEDAYSINVFKPEEKGIARLEEIKRFLSGYFPPYSNQIKEVALEGYAFGSQMANMLGELGGMVKLTLFERGFYPVIVPPTTLKKYVTGKGTGVPKSQMMLAIYKKWGADLPDDNAADSYALARIAQKYYTLAYEEEIINKLKDPKFKEK